MIAFFLPQGSSRLFFLENSNIIAAGPLWNSNEILYFRLWTQALQLLQRLGTSFWTCIDSSDDCWGEYPKIAPRPLLEWSSNLILITISETVESKIAGLVVDFTYVLCSPPGPETPNGDQPDFTYFTIGGYRGFNYEMSLLCQLPQYNPQWQPTIFPQSNPDNKSKETYHKPQWLLVLIITNCYSIVIITEYH